jgi:Acetyltransferase (GNAT) domain
LDKLEFFCEPLSEVSSTSAIFLFNEKNHLLLQSKKDWVVYGLREKSGKIIMAISIFTKGQIASSPLRAPFGGLEIHQRISSEQVNFFFEVILSDLKARGVRKLSIKQSPIHYQPLAAKLILKATQKLDFKFRQEVTSIIPVDGTPFEKKIAVSERQKLKKGIARFTFEHNEPAQLKKIYSFIETCRKERNQSLSMTYSELKKAISKFPHEYLLFSVKEDQKIAAAAIVIRVSAKVLYTFYYAHARVFDKVSPIVCLMHNLYSYAEENNCKMIDLGTSIVNGNINQPLLHFKKSIGGQPSLKYFLEKDLI